MRAARWAPYLLTGLVAVALAAGVASWLQRYAWLPLWAQSLAIFAAVKVGGDLAWMGLCRRHELLFFYEDFLRELVAFLLLGGLAALAIAFARRYIGAGVSPAVPAVGAYLTLLLVPARRRP
ncbi:MAG: hypothetical protein K6T75_09510 [Acetobacteraceae bacterium]|nr:hypothetical protein [Acetobacteraceae bacterium]